MANPCLKKTLLPPFGSSTKTSSSFSSSPIPALSFSELRALVQTFFLSHYYRISRTITKAKTIVIQFVRHIHFIHITMKKNKNKNKLFLGSFRLHYNWCSSHVVPVPVIEGFSRYGTWSNDSSWNTLLSSTDSCDTTADEGRLSGYLHWLEHKTGGPKEEDSVNEIDRIADMFIADNHLKFMLEKVESYRRFQEMMARSI